MLPRAEGCPKRMVMGPCGGVRHDGSCEVHADPCVFDGTARWPEPVPPVPPPRLPLVLADFSCDPYSVPALQAVAAALAPGCDAVLVGEHQNRPDFPPTFSAALLREAGLRPWVTLGCRDRNRIVLEQEVVGLREVGVDAVLCVTGDARGYGVRPEVTQVFDLDGPRLAALAATHGVPAAVAETPTAPPRRRRPFRLAQKQRAGAAVAVLNYATPAQVAEFVAAAHAEGATLPIIASAPVYTDARSAAVLDVLPGLDLDRSRVDRVLADRDPVRAGIRSAADEAGELLTIDGVVGVNLSGSGSARGHVVGARIKAETGRLVRAEHDPGTPTG